MTVLAYRFGRHHDGRRSCRGKDVGVTVVIELRVLQVELDRTGDTDPIKGRVRVAATVHEFSGWMELVQILDDARPDGRTIDGGDAALPVPDRRHFE